MFSIYLRIRKILSMLSICDTYNKNKGIVSDEVGWRWSAIKPSPTEGTEVAIYFERDNRSFEVLHLPYYTTYQVNLEEQSPAYLQHCQCYSQAWFCPKDEGSRNHRGRAFARIFRVGESSPSSFRSYSVSVLCPCSPGLE
jgi:hypothetical protein